jgi:hypothetical protein
VKAHWRGKLIDALRSGGYRRCTGTMRLGDEYCALGVLMEALDEVGLALDEAIAISEMIDAGASLETVADWIEAFVPVE